MATTEWCDGAQRRRRRVRRSGNGAMRVSHIVGAVSAFAAVSGIAQAVKVTLETAAGDFTTRDLAALATNTQMFGGSIDASVRLNEAVALSANIAHIAAEIAVFTSDWSDVTTDYTADYKYWVEDAAALPLSSNEWTRLKAVPLTSADPAVTTAAAASDSPITDYVTAAVAQASGATNREAAREMIEKTLWDATIYQGALLHLGTAQDDASSPAFCVTGASQTDATAANWDIGAALIIGDGYHSILGRANKRGAEFGTMSGSVASTTEKIVKYLRAGQEEKDCAKLHDIYEDIEKQMRIVYSQSIIKYAFKLDAAIAAGTAKAYSDDQAEGQALYRVIAGDIHGKDSDTTKAATKMFNALFDVRSKPKAYNTYAYGHYCQSISHLKRILGLSDAQLGTYSAADEAGVTCNPSSTKLSTIAGMYYPSSTSDASGAFADAIAMSENIAHINAEISTFTTDWSDITNDYGESYKKWTETSPITSNEWTRLVGTPLTSVAPTSTAEAAASSTPITTYLNEAVAAASTETYRAAAKEMIEKTLWDATLYHGSLNFLNRAQDDDNGVCVTSSTRTDATKLAWDIGAALIIGDGYHSILGRANKRGAEFGTMSGSVASTYEKIVKYLRNGQEEKDCAKLHEVYEDIEKQMRIIYGQSIIKYAYKIDKGLKDDTLKEKYSDDVAEGQALYRVIAGDIKAKGDKNGFPDHYKFFNTLFDVRSVPERGSWDYDNYCTSITYVKESLGMTDESKYDFGTYYPARYINCDSKSESTSTSSDVNIKKAVRPAEALAAFSFIIAIAGVVLGSISVHKIRKGGSGSSAFKSSYVIQHI